MSSPKIEIDRSDHGWVDRARAYEVFIDGISRGKIRHGERVELEVDPGPRSVQLAIDWCRSPAIMVNAAPEAPLRLSCRPSSLLRLPYAVTFGRKRYIHLESIS